MRIFFRIVAFLLLLLITGQGHARVLTMQQTQGSQISTITLNIIRQPDGYRLWYSAKQNTITMTGITGQDFSCRSWEYQQGRLQYQALFENGIYKVIQGDKVRQQTLSSGLPLIQFWIPALEKFCLSGKQLLTFYAVRPDKPSKVYQFEARSSSGERVSHQGQSILCHVIEVTVKGISPQLFSEKYYFDSLTGRFIMSFSPAAMGKPELRTQVLSDRSD